MSPLVLRSGQHLFIDGDSNHINLQHQAIVTIPESRKSAWLEIIRARAEAAALVGAEFLFLLAPDKQSVYRHILPSSYSCRPATFLLQHSSVIDIAPSLASVAQVVDVYPRTDSHWNHLGAYIAATVIEARRGRNLACSVDRWDEPVGPGDLGHKLASVEQSARMTAIFNPGAVLLYDNMVPNNGRVRIFCKPVVAVAEPTRLLLVGDSFSYELVHILKEAFDVTVQLHSFALDHTVLSAFRPTLLLCELTERFVFRLPEISDGHVLPALWLQKIAAGERIQPARQAAPVQASTLPRVALDMLAFITTMFRTYEPELRHEAGFIASNLSTVIDEQVRLPGLREQPIAVRDILRSLLHSQPDSNGIALSLYAAASRPVEAPGIVDRLQDMPALSCLEALPPALQPLFLMALRNAGRQATLVRLLRAGRHCAWHSHVLTFALDTLIKARRRPCRYIAAGIARRLAANALRGPAAYRAMCQYLLGYNREQEAIAQLEAYIDACDLDAWPVITLAELHLKKGDRTHARSILNAAIKRIPSSREIAALRSQLETE